MCSVAVEFSHLTGAPLGMVADFGTKYGDPLSMMMAVYGGVVVVGQAVKSPSDRVAMIICVFIVVPACRFYISSFYHVSQ